jgi:hypothetical protein
MSGTGRACSVPLPAGVQALAQAEAERHFGDGPVAAWHPSGALAAPMPSLRRGWWLAAAACLGLAAVAAVAWWAGHRDALPEAPVAVTQEDGADTPTLMPLPPRPELATAPPPSPSLNITRHDGVWRIEADGVSRLVAAQRFAQASGSPLLGNTMPLAATRPLHLRWQGRDPAAAWQAVLGSDVSFAMRCGASRCRVWIAEAGTSPEVAAPRGAAAAPAATVGVAEAAPQSDSADPRVAAHHD